MQDSVDSMMLDYVNDLERLTVVLDQTILHFVGRMADNDEHRDELFQGVELISIQLFELFRDEQLAERTCQIIQILTNKWYEKIEGRWGPNE